MSSVLPDQTDSGVPPTATTEVDSELEQGAKTEELEPTVLEKLRERFPMQVRTLVAVFFFCVFFMYHNYAPLNHTDIWGHVSYGYWILEHEELPTRDPWVKHAEGMPIVCTAWLGQILFALGHQQWGAEGASCMFALISLSIYLLLFRSFQLQSRSTVVSLFGVMGAFLFAFSRHRVIRPENFGLLCFAFLIWLVVRSDPDRTRQGEPPSEFHLQQERTPWVFWITLPILFALWANLHGSFVMGFALIFCLCLGRVIQVFWQTKSIVATLRDRLFRRWLIAGEVAVAATCLNPYGFDLLVHTFMFPSNPNLESIIEWYRLSFLSVEGIQATLAMILLVVLFRHSRARITPADVLMLIIYTLAMCLRVRMTTWFAPIVVMVLIPHLADVGRQLRQSSCAAGLRTKLAPLLEPSFNYTMVACLFVWLGFVLSPFGSRISGGATREDHHVYSSHTPQGITRYLREHPPRGMVAGPQWWGDWLLFDGPEDLQVMMTTNAVHAVPPRVWNDYMAIANSSPRMPSLLNRYRINTVILDKSKQDQLQEAMRKQSGWKIVYEDDLGLIYSRLPKTAR